MNIPKKVKVKNTRDNVGYRMVFVPDYDGAYSDGCWKGWCYEHRYLMELEIGRYLNSDEDIHHLDGNKKNNRMSNLLFLTHSQHLRLHAWLEMAMPDFEEFSADVPYCQICNSTLQEKQVGTCSLECEYERKSVNIPDKELLEYYLKNFNFVEIGKKFNVSDNAVRKWCKKYSIPCHKAELKQYFANKIVDTL